MKSTNRGKKRKREDCDDEDKPAAKKASTSDESTRTEKAERIIDEFLPGLINVLKELIKLYDAAEGHMTSLPPAELKRMLKLFWPNSDGKWPDIKADDEDDDDDDDEEETEKSRYDLDEGFLLENLFTHQGSSQNRLDIAADVGLNLIVLGTAFLGLRQLEKSANDLRQWIAVDVISEEAQEADGEVLDLIDTIILNTSNYVKRLISPKNLKEVIRIIQNVAKVALEDELGEEELPSSFESDLDGDMNVLCDLLKFRDFADDLIHDCENLLESLEKYR